MARERFRVLLINPRVSGEIRYGVFKEVGSYMPPYGLICIAAVLEEHGCEVKVVDAESRRGATLADVEAAIESFDPQVIGMTAYSIARDSVIETADFIKGITQVPVVVGGPHVITLAEDYVDSPSIDIMCYGEGEYVMVDIVEHLKGNLALDDIDGIIYRTGGDAVKTPPRAMIEDLDTLPYPAFHLLDNLSDYRPTPLLYKKHPVMTLVLARGCPFNCIFCYSIWGKKVRYNSPSYIVGLVAKLVTEFGTREILFYEDSFCLKKERINEICDLLIESKLGIAWSCSANAKTVSPELFEKMKRAGCWLVSMGIESGNDEVLKFIKKPVTTEIARKACKYADDAGIRIRGFFMLGHPVDTKETIRQTIDFAKSLPLFAINLCILQLMPGSEVREIAHNYGTVDYDYTLGTGHPGRTMSFVPKGLTSEYLANMQKRGYREFFFRPAQIYRLLREMSSWEDIKKYATLLKTFVKFYLSR